MGRAGPGPPAELLQNQSFCNSNTKVPCSSARRRFRACYTLHTCSLCTRPSASAHVLPLHTRLQHPEYVRPLHTPHTGAPAPPFTPACDTAGSPLHPVFRFLVPVRASAPHALASGPCAGASSAVPQQRMRLRPPAHAPLHPARSALHSNPYAAAGVRTSCPAHVPPHPAHVQSSAPGQGR